MREYLENLTGHLIGKNNYREIFEVSQDIGDFKKHVKLDLLVGDVKDMRPETLGKIMCSFEIGDVMASKQDIFNNVTFSGDCDDFLRELVSLCLAYAIRDKLNSQIQAK